LRRPSRRSRYRHPRQASRGIAAPRRRAATRMRLGHASAGSGGSVARYDPRVSGDIPLPRRRAGLPPSRAGPAGQRLTGPTNLQRPGGSTAEAAILRALLVHVG
jgi:hypothetical protein